MAGLLGVTVIGAVLRSRQAAALRGGASAQQAFLDGYHTGLWVTIALLAAGVVLSYVALRPRSQEERQVAPQVGAVRDATAIPEPVPVAAIDARLRNGDRDS